MKKSTYFIVLGALLILTARTVVSQTPLRKQYAQARAFMKDGQCEKALVVFNSIEKEYVLLRDYVLFDAATCYEATQEKEKAVQTYGAVIGGYRDSPLYKKAFIKAIELGKEVTPEKTMPLIERYINEFPSDDRGRYTKAGVLSKLGRDKDAFILLKEVFLRGGPNCVSAFRELLQTGYEPSGIEMEKAGKALLQKGAYKNVIELLEGTVKNETGIKHLLGTAYFRTRNYKMAARYLKDDQSRESKVMLASIMLRNGEKERAQSLIWELSEAGDSNLYDLLYRLMDIKRRDGNFEDAKKGFQELLSRYPGKGQDIKWAMAWLEIRRKNYDEAEKQLTALAATNTAEKDRYLFWLGKLAVYRNKNGEPFFSQLAGNERYYRLRVNGADLKTTADDMMKNSASVSPDESKGYKNISSVAVSGKDGGHGVLGVSINGSIPERLKKVYLRALELYYIGMNHEASAEIRRVSEDIKKADITMFTSLLAVIGDFRTPIILAGNDENLLDLRYPFAYREKVIKTAQKKGVDPLLVLSVIREESRFDTVAVSEAGALGLMQLMPATAKKILNIKRDDEIFDIEKNIYMGVSHLAYLSKRYKKLSHVIAAYNAGEHRVDSWLAGGYNDDDEFIDDIPFKETRDYVKKVLRSYYIYKGMYGETTLNSKFQTSNSKISPSPKVGALSERRLKRGNLEIGF